MLGTSIGRVGENGYSAIDKTSFGVDSSDKLSFFTGKPYVEDMGYAFLLRNYRAGMGKWLSQDLIGYLDGWNSFAYCRNSIISNYDIYGAVIGVYCAPDAVSGAGHLAMIVGNASTGYSYYSFGLEAMALLVSLLVVQAQEAHQQQRHVVPFLPIKNANRH